MTPEPPCHDHRLTFRVTGYSYMSNEYGLTIDNMAGYELVLPNGTITNVTSRDKDLWFALRVSDLKPNSHMRRFAKTTSSQGGGNNFVRHLLPWSLEGRLNRY